jgi:hypothetical protein
MYIPLFTCRDKLISPHLHRRSTLPTSPVPISVALTTSANHQNFSKNEEALRVVHKLSLTLLVKHIDSNNDKE